MSASDRSVRCVSCNEIEIDRVFFFPEDSQHVQSSLDLRSLSKRPFKARSLPKEVKYQKSPLMCANNEFLLLCTDGELHLFNTDLKLTRSTEGSKITSSELIDMAWCESLSRFIILTKEKVYLLNLMIMQLLLIEDIRLQSEERRFTSCACSSTTLFIAVSQSWNKSYLYHYSLPRISFVARLSMVDLIGTDLPPSTSTWSSLKAPIKEKDDDREIHSIRYNQQRLAVMITCRREAFLYVLGSQRQSETASKTALPWYDGHLCALAGSAGWLLIKENRDQKLLQIDLDCRYKAEWAPKDRNQDSFFTFSTGFVELKGNVTNAVMFGPSHLVVLLDHSLALYQAYT